jgi:hypothetical protein
MDSGQEARLVAFVLERSADSVVSRARSRRPRADDGGNTESQREGTPVPRPSQAATSWRTRTSARL